MITSSKSIRPEVHMHAWPYMLVDIANTSHTSRFKQALNVFVRNLFKINLNLSYS